METHDRLTAVTHWASSLLQVWSEWMLCVHLKRRVREASPAVNVQNKQHEWSTREYFCNETKNEGRNGLRASEKESNRSVTHKSPTNTHTSIHRLRPLIILLVWRWDVFEVPLKWLLLLLWEPHLSNSIISNSKARVFLVFNWLNVM